MAESIKIQIFRKMDAEDFTKALADPESRAQTGSGTAMTAAVASALLQRAARATQSERPESERVAYIVRNSEILRSYMGNLIDEDVEARGPYRKALKDGDPRGIEAAGQSVGAVCAEIVNMMTTALSFLEELAELCPAEEKHFVAESADLALAAIRASMRFCVHWGNKSSEDTRRYVIRRENELQWEQILPSYQRVIEKVEK